MQTTTNNTATAEHVIPVIDELQRQDEILRELRQRLDTLESRLSPIVRPSVPELSGSHSVSQSSGQSLPIANPSPVVGSIRNQQLEARALIDRVSFLINNLDL